MSYSFISKEANEMKRNFEKENRNVDKGIEHAGFMLDRLSQVFFIALGRQSGMWTRLKTS